MTIPSSVRSSTNSLDVALGREALVISRFHGPQPRDLRECVCFECRGNSAPLGPVCRSSQGSSLFSRSAVRTSTASFAPSRKGASTTSAPARSSASTSWLPCARCGPNDRPARDTDCLRRVAQEGLVTRGKVVFDGRYHRHARLVRNGLCVTEESQVLVERPRPTTSLPCHGPLRTRRACR